MIKTNNTILDLTFYTIRQQWTNAMAHMSTVNEAISDPAYQRIIGLGEDALPYIFDSLENETELWFPALHAITNEKPEEEQTEFVNELEYWYSWANKHGYYSAEQREERRSYHVRELAREILDEVKSKNPRKLYETEEQYKQRIYEAAKEFSTNLLTQEDIK